MRLICIAALAALVGICAQAQEKKVVRVEDRVFVSAAGGSGTIAHFSIVASPVKGAPYSADVTTETIQTLGDGNRIVNSYSAKQYRDTEGRTRSDSAMHAVGPWTAGGQPPSVTNITDPVAGVRYFINHQGKTAMKIKLPPPKPPDPSGHPQLKRAAGVPEGKVVFEGAAGEQFNVRVPAPAGMPGMPGMPEMMWVEALPHSSRDSAAKSESLGKQTVEGVECEGTRTTMTLAAGAIGNERPIVTVTEEWYSPKLRMVILSKRTDPRFGESTMKLTRIVQADQPRSLFEPPSDYRAEEPDTPVLKRKQEE